MSESNVLPSDWAIKKAVELSGLMVRIEVIKESPRPYRTLLTFAKYIEEHEEPPVDPALIRAREILADIYQESPIKERIMEGKWDRASYLQAILKALKEEPPC